MKVRLIKKKGYDTLYAVEVKRRWWPFWMEIFYHGLKEAEAYYDRLMATGNGLLVLKEGELK